MRNIYTVTATNVVVSESHPEGLMSDVQGYPKTFDSRSYGATEQNPNGSTDTALIVAQAEFADAVKTLTLAANPNRVMWTVTLEQANGVQIMKKSWGAMPDMTPVPDAEEAGEE